MKHNFVVPLILLFRSIKLFTRLEHPITSQKMTLAGFSSFFSTPIFKRSINCYFNVLLLNFTSQNVLNLFLFFSSFQPRYSHNVCSSLIKKVKMRIAKQNVIRNLKLGNSSQLFLINT